MIIIPTYQYQLVVGYSSQSAIGAYTTVVTTTNRKGMPMNNAIDYRISVMRVVADRVLLIISNRKGLNLMDIETSDTVKGILISLAISCLSIAAILIVVTIILGDM